MIYSPDNLRYCLGYAGTAFAGFCQQRQGEHFRLVSLAMTGETSEPCYSAVMVKTPRPFRTNRPELRQSARAMTSIMATLAADPEPLYPYLIAATGNGTGTVYAAAFREMDEPPVVDLSMTAGAFADKNAEQRELGRILLSVDAFGTEDAIRYCAIWGVNRKQLAWNAEAVNDMGEADQERYEVLTSIGARPALIQMTPAEGLLRLYVDDRLKHGWVSRPVMSRAQMDSELRAQADAGFYPISIGMNRVGRVNRFAAIFAKSNEILPRSWRVNGPDPIGLSDADQTQAATLDDWVENFVKTHNLRGAALAVIDGQRLVYAKGYTWAEADYPDLLPETPFRTGSVSKFFCAMAVWALMDRLLITIPMQSLLHLTQPDGSAPADADFANVTIQQLLESESGIDQLGVRSSIKDNRDAQGAQPLTSAEVAKMVAARDMPYAPGTETSYGRTDYFLLSQIVAKLADKTEFESGLRTGLLAPLGMIRTHGSRSALEDQRPGDARHHTPDLATGTSVVHDDFRLVPVQYGAENLEVYDGAGGLSSAAVDLARLCAMLSCRIGNPVLEAATIDRILDMAVEATSNGAGPDPQGYHGLDWARYDNNANRTAHRATIEKGGSLPGARAGLHGIARRRICVFMRNGQGWPTASAGDWTQDLLAIANNINWAASGDLFPDFDMDPFGVSATTTGPTPVQKAGPKLRPQ